MNKPTANTAWATAESAKKVEPLESQRQSGWVHQDTPSSGVINSWMNAVHQWRSYLEQTVDEQEEHLDALEQHVVALEAVVKYNTDEIKRLDAWLGRIQAYIESHPTTQPAPSRPEPGTPPPGMPSYKWDQIQRNQGRGPR